MRFLLFFCSGLLILALANLPMGYYTFLRIIVTIGAVVVIVTEWNNGFNFWVIAFGIVAIVFNPILPIYLNDKEAWMPIDVICAILFTIKGLTINQKKE